jgi:hypothetical protein
MESDPQSAGPKPSIWKIISPLVLAILVIIATFCVAPIACSTSKTVTVSLKAGQQYTVRNLRSGLKVRVLSSSPVDISLSECRASQVNDFECTSQGDDLTLVDSRNSFNVFGNYNRVTVIITKPSFSYN